jgi:hypothetical protein
MAMRLSSQCHFFVDTMSTTVPGLFALVIGINEYKELRPKLYGAVADANAMIEYLSSKTSASRILSLKNEQATRESIVEAFKTLNRSKEIEKNDPIVIYFSGHGGEAQIQGQEEMTQMIMPYDASPRTQDKDEIPVIPGIPDFEIRKFLNDIAAEKGNNIVRLFFPTSFFQFLSLHVIMVGIDGHIRLLLFWTWNTP